ncbi:MAG: energy-coupling factor ABC transporter substrate-binding protein [Marinifilaceae bacterium]
MKKQNILLLLGVVLLIVLPLLFNGNAEYGGADGLAEEMIGQIDPGYQAWYSNIWEPPSGEIESLLFALQAAIGAGIVCYVIGYYKGKKSGAKA